MSDVNGCVGSAQFAAKISDPPVASDITMNGSQATVIGNFPSLIQLEIGSGIGSVIYNTPTQNLTEAKFAGVSLVAKQEACVVLVGSNRGCFDCII